MVEVKPLSNGDFAISFINLSEGKMEGEVSITMERILHFLKEKFVNADSLANATRFTIKDLFTKEERELQERTFSVSG